MRDRMRIILISLFISLSLLNGSSLKASSAIEADQSKQFNNQQESEQSKSWDEIISLLPKIHNGDSVENVFSTIGKPHEKKWGFGTLKDQRVLE
jgi:hypothetical protein